MIPKDDALHRLLLKRTIIMTPQTKIADIIRYLAENKIAVRSAPVVPSSYDEKTHSARFTLATETPCPVFDYERWEIVNEVLMMDGMMMPDRGQIPLLDCHNRSSIEYQLGSCRDLTVQGPMVDCLTVFDSTAEGQRAEIKVREGHVTDISVGYRQIETQFVPLNQKATIKGREFTGPIRVTSQWMPREGSLTPVGADMFAKVRSGDMLEAIRTALESIGLKKEATQEEITEFIKKRNDDNPPADGVGQDNKNHKQRSTIMEKEVIVNTPTPEELKRQAAENERVRVEEINAIAANYADRVGGKEKMNEFVKDAVTLKRSAELFRGDIYTRVLDSRPLEIPPTRLDMSEGDKKRYSITRAIRHLVDGKGGDVEAEASKAIAERVGIAPHGGLYIPEDIQRNEMRIPADVQRQIDQILTRNGINARALSTGSATGGQTLVGTQHRPQDFIELLRNGLIQGITILSGLSSSVDIPKQTGGSTITSGLAEGTDFTETAPTFGQLTLAPKDIGAWVEMTRRLLIQSSPAVDALVATDLITALAIKVNYLALYGGGGLEPTGLINTSSVGTVAGAGIDWHKILEFLSDIGSSNVTGLLEFLTNSTIQSLLMGRPKESGFPVYLMGEDNKLAGKAVQISEQVAAGYLICGKMSEIILGEFGTMEVAYDRNSLSKSGGLRIAVYHAIDVGVRHPGAFSFATGVN
jgi:HK97 family phage major capsid protein